MHPILTRRGALPLYVSVWAATGGSVCFSLAFMGVLSWETAFAGIFPLILLDAFICLSPWYLCRIFPVETSRIGILVLTHTAAAVFSTVLLSATGYGWALLLKTNPVLTGLPGEYLPALPACAVSATVLYLLSTLTHYLLANAEIARERKKREIELRLYAREAELKVLRSQIDPHFLFNSLNSINALIPADPMAARSMCIKLADFLRGSLAVGQAPDISLSDELGLVRSYLAVEKIRLAERLNTAIDAPPDTLGCRVPPLLLQPLVENAIKHGVARLIEGGTVGISAERNGDRLRLVVTNPCDDDRPGRLSGMGLSIVRRRLETAYGNHALLAVEDGGDTFKVEVVLPCRN